MKNPLIPIAIIIAGAIVAGAIIFTSQASPKIVDTEGDKATDIKLREVDKNDHILGNPDAKVTIVEYSDIQCRFCKSFHTTMNKIMDEYGKDGDVAWVFRHHPLDDFYGAPSNLHPEARPAAIATECVAREKGNDAFWTFTDNLFEKQDSLGIDLYIQGAVALGIDEADFRKCLDDESMLELVIEDEQNGQLRFGTPYSVAIANNGKKAIPINGALPYQAVKDIIDGLLAEEN